MNRAGLNLLKFCSMTGRKNINQSQSGWFEDALRFCFSPQTFDLPGSAFLHNPVHKPYFFLEPVLPKVFSGIACFSVTSGCQVDKR